MTFFAQESNEAAYAPFEVCDCGHLASQHSLGMGMCLDKGHPLVGPCPCVAFFQPGSTDERGAER